MHMNVYMRCEGLISWMIVWSPEKDSFWHPLKKSNSIETKEWKHNLIFWLKNDPKWCLWVRRSLESPWDAPGASMQGLIHLWSIVLVYIIFSSLLGSRFNQFINEILNKKYMHFCQRCACLLSTWRHPKIMHRRSVLNTFHFVVFFFSEICEKFIENKYVKNWYP